VVGRGLDYAGARPGGRAIHDAGYRFVVRYLSDGGPGLPGKLLTPAEADDLRANGIDIVSNWETTANWMLGGYQAGVDAATRALAQVLKCGGRTDRPIYFSADWDATPQQQQAIDDCLRGCASVIGAENVGIYAGLHVVRRCLDNGTARWAWQTYAWSGGEWEPRAQLRQRNDLGYAHVNGVECDINEAWAADYGQWSAVTPTAAKGEVMFTDDDRRMLQRIHDELTKSFPSRSPFRRLGEGLVDSGFGMLLNVDGNSHALIIERLASYGDPTAIALLNDIAGADLSRYPERATDKQLAQRILDRLHTGSIEPALESAPALQYRIAQDRRLVPDRRHVLFTVSGTFADELSGYPADVGRRVDTAIYRWQPVKYPATFGNPSYAHSVQAGVEELIRQIKAQPDTTFAFCGYSQGGEVVSRVFAEMQRPDGQLHDRMSDFIGAAVFGNPMRQHGRTFAGNPNPNAPGINTRGIAATTLTDTPDIWAEYVNAGDLYADVPEGAVGADITSIYQAAVQFEYSDPQNQANPLLNLVNFLGAVAGPGGVLQQLLQIINNPLGIIDAMRAAGYALQFVATQPPTAPHITYHEVECIPGQNSVDHAVTWLNALAAQRPLADMPGLAEASTTNAVPRRRSSAKRAAKAATPSYRGKASNHPEAGGVRQHL